MRFKQRWYFLNNLVVPKCKLQFRNDISNVQTKTTKITQTKITKITQNIFYAI